MATITEQYGSNKIYIKQFEDNCPWILKSWKHVTFSKYPSIKNRAVKRISIFGTKNLREPLYANNVINSVTISFKFNHRKFKRIAQKTSTQI